MEFPEPDTMHFLVTDRTAQVSTFPTGEFGQNATQCVILGWDWRVNASDVMKVQVQVD